MRLSLCRLLVGSRLHQVLGVSVALLPGCADQQNNETLFAAHVDFSVPGSCADVRLADLDGDGRLEVVAAIFDGAAVSILRSESGDPFQLLEDLTIPVGLGPFALAIADLNGDQKPDLIVVNGGSDSISVLLNSSSPGATSFLPRSDLAVNVKPRAIGVGDLNGDGKLDVAVTRLVQEQSSEAAVSIFLNDTASGATTPVFLPEVAIASGSLTNSVAFGDLNGDGKLDVVGANLFGGAVVVSLNQTPNGAAVAEFAPALEFNVGDSGSVALVDLTEDGSLDLAVAEFNSGNVTVLVNRTVLGSSTPAFESSVEFAAGRGPISIALVDADLNGTMDLAVADLGGGVSILVNELTNLSPFPSLRTSSELSVGMEPDSITAGDLDGDGKADLVTGNRDGTISVLLAR